MKLQKGIDINKQQTWPGVPASPIKSKRWNIWSETCRIAVSQLFEQVQGKTPRLAFSVKKVVGQEMDHSVWLGQMYFQKPVIPV